MLKGKTIIITGASSGIGKAMTSSFLKDGANVVMNSRNRDLLEAILEENNQYSAQLAYVAGDIGIPETSKLLTNKALELFGSIDVLINNAGTFTPKPFLDETEESLDAYFRTAVKGSYFSAQSVIPTMIKQHNGSIINIGSMWVDHPLIQTPCSASQVSKAGMHTLTKHLAIEFAQNNIRVNTIAPAIIDTPLYDNLMSHEELLTLRSLHPLNLLGNVSDIYTWAKHLSGEGSRFVTGQTFFIDGGITAGGHR